MRNVTIVIPAQAGIQKSRMDPRGSTELTEVLRGGDIKKFTLRTVADWERVVLFLLPRLHPGDILALSGPLGAGKTTFVQHLAKELGIPKTPQSPTFSLVRSYRLPKSINGISRLVHVDAYRIEDERDLLPLDLDAELADQKTLLAVEWPERVPNWLLQKSSVVRVDVTPAPLRAPGVRRRGAPRPRS